MKKINAFLMKKYQLMSGDKKVRIAFDLSNMVQRIYKEGKIVREKRYGSRPS